MASVLFKLCTRNKIKLFFIFNHDFYILGIAGQSGISQGTQNIPSNVLSPMGIPTNVPPPNLSNNIPSNASSSPVKSTVPPNVPPGISASVIQPPSFISPGLHQSSNFISSTSLPWNQVSAQKSHSRYI